MPNFFSGPFITKPLIGFGLWCCLFLIPTAVQSATNNSATLQWVANTESDLAGYKVYQGAATGSYGPSIDVKKATTYRASNLQAGQTYSFAVTAYDLSGNESPPSKEVRKYIAQSSPDVTSSSLSLTSLTNKTTATVTAANQAPPTVDAGLTPIDQSGWTVEYVNSQERGYEAPLAFDGLNTTFWHTEYQRSEPEHPHDLIVDLGAVYSMEGFRVLQRQDGPWGRIGQYEFYVKTDSRTAPTTPPVVGEWTKVATGRFPNTALVQEVLFAVRNSRYVWLRAMDEAQVNGNPNTSLAELNVLGTSGSGGSSPITGSGDRPPIAESSPDVTSSSPSLTSLTNKTTAAVTAANQAPPTVDAGLTPIDQSGWTVEYVNSQERGYEASLAFDGLNTTFWHTEYQRSEPAHPHDLIVDLGAVYSMGGFRVLQRQDGPWGRIGQYELYVKTDSGTAPTTPPVVGEWTQVATGRFPNTALVQEVLFAVRNSRYVWLRAMDEAQGRGNPNTSLAELNVLGTSGSGDRPLIAQSSPDVTSSSPSLTSLTNKTTAAVTAANQAPPTVDAGLTPIDQSGWTVEYVNSQERGYEASLAFDGLNTTFWHTEYQRSEPAHPHDLIVDLGAVYSMGGFRVLQRQDGPWGRIGQYELYVKTDSGTAPTTPPVVGEWTQVATGRFPNTALVQEVLFAVRNSRYVWLRAMDEAQGRGNPNTSLAELNVLGTSGSGGSSPIAVGGGILLTDDFADGNFNGWQIIDEGTVQAPSAWTVVNKVLKQSSNIYDGDLTAGGLPKLGTFAWYADGLGWNNYQLTAQIQSTDNDALGVMVRYQDPDNYYRFSWDSQRSYRRLVKVVNGTLTLLATEAVPYVRGQAYQLDVLADGTTIEVRVDGVPLFGGPVTDSDLGTGSVALYSWGNQGSLFDDVVVTAVGGGNTAPAITSAVANLAPR